MIACLGSEKNSLSTLHSWLIMKRKTQAQRRAETKSAVLAAAVEVLISNGYANFSSVRVASRAGVSRGALERYFPTKGKLLIAATEYALDTAITNADRLAARANAHTVEQFLHDSEHFFFSPTYRALIELAIGVANDRDLAARHRLIVARARRRLNRTWLNSLQAAGFSAESAERFILLTHYLLRGVFLVDSWLPYKPNRKAVLETWSALAPAVLGLKHASASLLRVPEAGAGPQPKKLKQRSATKRRIVMKKH
jgi:AcrR family transcriptional regulator